jgi:anaerobic selenocysteine-containing dehydrogenase
MNQQDMDDRNLQKKDVVDIYNYDDGVERVARKFMVAPYPIPRSCTATYYPETNVLVPINSVAEKSNTPVSKQIVIKIKKQGA